MFPGAGAKKAPAITKPPLMPSPQNGIVKIPSGTHRATMFPGNPAVKPNRFAKIQPPETEEPEETEE